MAKAIKKVFSVEPPPYEVVLTLTQKEVETLRTILGHVAGCPHNSPRGYADGIRHSLEGLGVDNIIGDATGEIMFFDIEKE